MFRSAPYLRSQRAATGLDGQYPAILDEALRHPRLLVVGEASIFLRHMAYLWAGAMLDVRQDTLLLPLLLDAADLAAHAQRHEGSGDPPGRLASFLNLRNQECGWGLDEEFFRVRLERGACLILVDGLDQVAPGEGHDSLCRMLESLSGNGPLGRMIIATRPTAVPQLKGFVIVRIEDPQSSLLQSTLTCR